MNNGILLHPVSFACHNFLFKGKEEIVTVVVAPIVVQGRGKKRQISYACSRGSFCETPTCIYAKGKEENETMVDEIR